MQRNFTSKNFKKLITFITTLWLNLLFVSPFSSPISWYVMEVRCKLQCNVVYKHQTLRVCNPGTRSRNASCYFCACSCVRGVVCELVLTTFATKIQGNTHILNTNKRVECLNGIRRYACWWVFGAIVSDADNTIGSL